MAAERLSMRKVSEALRQHAEGRSARSMAQSLGVAHSTVLAYLRRARTAGLGWPLPAELTEGELEQRLFPPPPPARGARPQPDWSEVHRELRRKGVTLQLLWLEYKEAHPDGYQYSQFCEHYRRWCGRLDLVLRQEHKAGEKVFVDFAGQTVPVVDRASGEIRQAQIFVGVLGASNYTYAEATWTQELPEWIGAHVHLYAYVGGVPALTIPDNLKSGVRHACYYDPDVNPTYHELATHYATAILPTRTARPRDKAKVEVGVQVVERWILARLRHHTFFGLSELNQEIRRLLADLNDRPFKKLPGTRRSLFEALDRPALRPLPPTPYEYARWKKARVNIDYHIEVLGHYYSVPYPLVRQEVDVRLTARTVEILHQGRRIAAHVKSDRRGAFTTDPAHRPKAHQRHLEWTPSRILRWAEQTGPQTAALVQHILESRPHPEQGYRACLGLFRLGQRHSAPRLEAACARALTLGAGSYRSVKSILQHGLDRLPLEPPSTRSLPRDHHHVRGASYYATSTTGDA